MGDTEVEKLLEGADSHTTYIYRNGYSEKRLPTHNTHAMVAAQREERQNINNFLNVRAYAQSNNSSGETL